MNNLIDDLLHMRDQIDNDEPIAGDAITKLLYRAAEELEKSTRDLRDRFAEKAMQGLIACGKDTDLPSSSFATTAYKFADAMLEARK